MKALILRDDVEKTADYAQILVKKGFQVVCVETRKAALAVIRIDTIDLLVMDEQVDGRLTHSLILSAERRNPYVSAIMMTDRPGPEVDDLYELIPCLYGLVGMDVDAKMLGRLALTGIENQAEADARVRRNALRYAEEDLVDDHRLELETEFAALDEDYEPSVPEALPEDLVLSDKPLAEVLGLVSDTDVEQDTLIADSHAAAVVQDRPIRASRIMRADERVHAAAP